MSKLRPLGSEKLPVDEKLKRIMEIANYGRTPKSTINENKSHKKVEFLMESTNGMYGIVKEGSSYYVQKGINESSLDYIGGMFMKDKNRFSSYSSALKRLELISGQETLNEAKKYVLKSKGGESSAPVEDIPAEPVAAEPEMDAPIDDAPVEGPEMDSVDGDEPIEDLPTDDLEDEGGDGKKSDYMEEVQKFSGKLGQALRDVKDNMESDDIKYVINMVLSAVDLEALDEDDREDIAEKFESKDDEDFVDNFDEDGEPIDGESDDEFEDEEIPSDEDTELDEVMSKLESFIDTDAIVDEEDDIDESDVDITQFNDLGMAETVSDVDEDVELDLDELKGEINKHVDATLSKYFK